MQTSRRVLQFASWVAILTLGIDALAAPPLVPGGGGARLSAAYERWLRDRIASGEILPADVVRRFGLDIPELEPALLEASTDALAAGGAIVPSFGVNSRPDAQINNRTGDATCSACLSRPLGQAETTIAARGNSLVASWNDTKGFCPPNGAVQGYGWSSDGGVTWADGGDVPALPSGGRYRGDPVTAVNPNTGRYYILGLYEGGAPGSGVALASGRFVGGNLVINRNTQIAVGGAAFLDKEWFDVDPTSGHVYVSWTAFGAGSDIEFQAFDSLGVALGPRQFVSSAAASGNVQGSRPVVGPDGEVYVQWYEFGFPESFIKIRRSDDFGATFGSEATAVTFFENGFSGAPGYRRGFAPTFASVAVDRTNGPQRGRVYLAWDEAVNFYDTSFSTSTLVNESENNDFFASADAFVIGNGVVGSISSTADVDMYRFNGVQGQTLYLQADQSALTLAMRLVCAADTSNVNNYRFLAFNQATLPEIVFTLPATGTYYLRLASASGTGGYRVLSALDTPSAGERARDHRDQFVNYSDDGTTWSTPVRVCDSDPWFDGIFPEVTVDGTGAVHVYWHDWRDDAACGAESYEYVTSSGDGGTTWGSNRRLSDERSFWSMNACGSANQGDYQGITSDGNKVYPCWSDSRLGDPDVFMEGFSHGSGAGCPTPTLYRSGTNPVVSFQTSNLGNVDGDFAWEVIDTNGWITSTTSGTANVAASGSADIAVSFHISSTCSPAADDTVRFIVRNLTVSGQSDTCSTVVSCTPDTDVQEFAPGSTLLAAPRPNPSRGATEVTFGLARAGSVRLEVFDVGGHRLRTLVTGNRGAGVHRTTWDGRDARGGLMPSGVYFVRLEAENRVFRRSVHLLR